MKSLFLTLSIVLLTQFATFAQLGIGNVPADSSILDLSNNRSFHLLLPKAQSDPDTTLLKNEAALLYYKGNLYLHTGNGMKIFTPWKWDGDSTHAISSPSEATVGIGINPVPGVLYRLQVAGVTDDITDTTTSSSVVIGNPLNSHLLIDENEIMAKLDPFTADTLRIQEEDGGVVIRGKSAKTTTTVLKANGSIDAAGDGSIKENGYDLLPKNTVIMWYGVCDANGFPLMNGTDPNKNWHICDGTNGTPDLRERFIVGGGGNNPTVTGAGYTDFPVNSSGGVNTVTLDTTQTPLKPHNHGNATGTASSSGSQHTHNITEMSSGLGWDGQGFNYTSGPKENSRSRNKNGIGDTDYAVNDGAHPHNVTVAVPTVSNTSATPHENRPPYYALIFIMKL